MPVRHVYAIEGRPAHFLKCLIVKNDLSMDRARFSLGDFVAYLEAEERVWDVAYCCGVLYHMADPAGLLRLLAKRSKRLILISHIYDQPAMKAADDYTAGTRFATDWMDAVCHQGVRHGPYIYYRRAFETSTAAKILGHGATTTDFANLVDADTLRTILLDVGGTILHWDQSGYERGPAVNCVATFDHSGSS